MKCEDSDYSELHGDSSWGPEDEEEAGFFSGSEVDDGKTRVEGEYKCSTRGALHLKPSLLKQHMCTHSQERLFVCPVANCGRQYKRRDHLNRHSLTHKGSLFACTWEVCDATFNVKSNLERHLRVHEKWGANVLRGSKRAESWMTCPEHGCGKSFKYPSLLQTHTENVHGWLPISETVCMEPGCGEVFDSPEMLKTHTKVAHSYVFCEICGVSMLKTSLAAHLRRHEEGQEWMRCPHSGCLHSYSKKSNLDTHIRAVHLELKPYVCSHAGCGMRFAYRGVRDKHEVCSTHVKAVVIRNFESEDAEFRLKSRGGRKRVGIQHVDNLLPRKNGCHGRE